LRRARAAVPDEDTLEAAARILDAVADPTRLRLMMVLSGCGELCVSELAEVTHTVESTTSHALRILRGTGLVRTRREGRVVHYRLADEHVAHMIHDVVEHALRCGAQR
jgi:DNA-binding transcriptional ArsR family regulator